MHTDIKLYIGRNIAIFLIGLTIGLFFSAFIDEVEDKLPDYIERQSYALSPMDLYTLSIVEEKLYEIIKDYEEKLVHEPQLFLKRYIEDYEGSSLLALKSWNKKDKKGKHRKISSNPLWSFRQMWRFTKDFSKIKDILYSTVDSEILDEIINKIKIDDTVAWPQEKDLNDSIKSLLTLHHVYNLNATEFAEGNISGVLTDATLSAVHCFEIAKFAFYNNKMYTYAIEWLNVADSKRSNSNGHPILDFVKESEISKLLDEIISEHDKIWIEEDPQEHNMHRFINEIDSEYVLTTQRSVYHNEYKSKGDSFEYVSNNDITAFTTLCKGGNLQTDKEKSELYCWYESKVHPAWYINPQKMELHSKEPYIFQVYNFIGNDFIRYLKNKAIPIMERAQISHPVNGENQEIPYHESRTSMYAWLNDEDDEKVLHLSERIGYLTGLRPHYSNDLSMDSLQIAAYATGGYFDIHTDSLEDTGDYQSLIDNNAGDRVATFMLYLSDVEHGGNTAFTSAGVSIPPVKGSATFWYDSKRNGQMDHRSWHGGCPVLIGEKWVGNKWIHQFPNFLHYKCSLNKDE